MIMASKSLPALTPSKVVNESARSDVDFLSTLVGGPVSAMALISLIQKVFHIGLAPVFADFVDRWREVTAPLASLLTFILPFKVPTEYCDLFVVSFVLASLFFRSLPAHENGVIDVILNWTFSFALSVGLFGYVLLMSSLQSIKTPRNSTDKESAARHLRYVFQVICLALVFYTANSKL